MTFKELFEEPEFKTVFDEVNQFANQQLEDYVNDLEQMDLQNGSKEIFDAVWGNIEFYNGEIYILDSPLLQRLRKIKQLGLAYFVYCGSDYSRFYHTIGVVYLVNRMVASINRCELGLNDEDKRYFKMVARLAAIFHDVGHMFLSHVSEHYFGKSMRYFRHNLISDMLFRLEKVTRKNIDLHELLSCMIVNTDIVRRLLGCVMPFLDTGVQKFSHSKIDDTIEYISSFIAGVPVDKKILPYSSVINGPIDADKCDYLSRDSHVTRVPVAVDISRITQKLSVVKTQDINMSQLWHDDGDNDSAYYELAMKDSAEKALFQLCIARTIMFDSVYYHHKVLTAETEFRSIINRLTNFDALIFSDFTKILNFTDGDLNKYFFDSLMKEAENGDRKEIEIIWHDLQKLYNRKFAKRIACITSDYLDGTQSDIENFFDDILTKIDSEEEDVFVKSVKEEYLRVCELVNNPLSDISFVKIFVIQAPTNIFGHSKIQVPIDLRNGNQRDFKGYELVSSRETSSSASYIVTEEKDRLLVLLALKKVLYQKYHVFLKDEAIACGKFEQNKVIKNSMQLFKQDYYDELPDMISDSMLFNYISHHKIEKLVNKYSAYEGPNGYKLSMEHALYFFKQIMVCCKNKKDCRMVVNGIYSLLEHALFFDREYISMHVGNLLEHIEAENNKLYVVPLGSLKDSGKHMMYFWNDFNIKPKEIETEKSLEQILQMSEVKHVIFFDDGSFSGTQLISIMQEYLGKKTKTNEHHVNELSEKSKECLLAKEITFFFIAFNVSKEKEIRQDLKEIGIQNIQFISVEDMSKKWLDDKIELFEDESQYRMVKDFLQEIGYEILKSSKMQNNTYKENWDEKRLKTSALGYNDAQQMVFLKSSVPTYTITAFWKRGTYHNMIWEPFLPRTEK